MLERYLKGGSGNAKTQGREIGSKTPRSGVKLREGTIRIISTISAIQHLSIQHAMQLVHQLLALLPCFFAAKS